MNCRLQIPESKEFALTGSSQRPLRELACNVLLERCGLDILQELLSVYPEETATTPEDVMIDTLHLLMAHWKGERTEVDVEAEGRDLLVVLDHVLEQIGKYIDDGGELLSEEEVLDELRTLCSEDGISLKTKVDVLMIAEKHLSLSEDDLQLVRVMKTGDVVGVAWPDDPHLSIKPEQLATAEARVSLLNLLISHTSTLKQAQAFITLLKLWPPFDIEIYNRVSNNPWIMIFSKVIEVTSDDQTAGLEVIMESHSSSRLIMEKQLPDESRKIIVEKLQSLGRVAMKCCMKIAFVSEDETIYGPILDTLGEIKEIRDSDYDRDLLDQVIRRELVPEITPTPLYGPLFTYLVETQDKQLVESVLGQLQYAGFEREAASLAFTQSSIPRSLQSFPLVQKYWKFAFSSSGSSK